MKAVRIGETNVIRIGALIVVACMTFAGFAMIAVPSNATPRTLKQVNMFSSNDGVLWVPVPGNQVSDFKLTLDGNAATWYYLDIKFIKPALENGEYGFYLGSGQDQAFWEYWAAKGVVEGASGWQAIMWQIINGDSAMFLLKVVDGAYMLVDGLQWSASGGTAYNHLRLNGDYPLGSYLFDGTGALDGISMTITFR